MLLLENAKLDERRRAGTNALRPLLDGLVAELEPWLGRDPYVPATKALLSRAGGRCEKDGTTLDFDPAAPHEHRCPTCGTIHRGEHHHRAWVTSYQLWLAERAVHGALLHLLRPDTRHAAFARDILRAYADRYLEYPNVDNVLGPTRLFFSTYLESIWLLQICVAADLVQQGGDVATADIVRDRIVEPSRALIADYDEGMSNRQVWNNAALLAAAALCNDDPAFDARTGGDTGLSAHLRNAVLSDGTWYEGENYHQFALRGLWYGVTLCEARRAPLDAALVERFDRAFVAPFLSALPDFTMPSRKDSQYAVSLRQWRLAELTELGFARTGNATLGGALARCYEAGHDRRDTGRARSTADVERNGPSGALTRADLGWRALLHALPELPPLSAVAPRSAHLEGQGLAVFRRADDVYVALDYGQSGGGHGHPDRLNLTLYQGATRWLDDMGTGSYVDPSLHWYRSTLAHNAPLADGCSQPLAPGRLTAYDEREGMGWISAHFGTLGSPISFQRTLVIAPDYLIDELHWSAMGRPGRIELPVHIDAHVEGLELRPAMLDGGDGLEDGFPFVSSVLSTKIPGGSPVRLSASTATRSLRVLFECSHDAVLYAANGPGQPSSASRRFLVVRAETGAVNPATSGQGVIRSVIFWGDDALSATFDRHEVTVALQNGERHVHKRVGRDWHVDLFAGSARSSIDLVGQEATEEIHDQPQRVSPSPIVLRRAAAPLAWFGDLPVEDRQSLLVFELSKDHYRRSERPWDAVDSPIATIAFAADDSRLLVFADIRAGDRRFAAADAANALDNEHADTMAAGVQLYLRSPDASGAWMLVPERSSDVVRVRSIGVSGTGRAPVARWREREAGGYEMRIELPVPSASAPGEYPLDVDVIINETEAGRDRRRGQLVLSGARGEFVYLRGDRHDPERFVPLIIIP